MSDACTYKSVYRLEFVETEELSKAGHCVEPDNEIHVLDMVGSALATARCFWMRKLIS